MLNIHCNPVLCIKLHLNVSFLPTQTNEFPFAAGMDLNICIFLQVTQEISDETRVFRLLGSDR